ncbi:glycosyltransferase family 39 protein [Thiotrichales bacterium 19S9-12]|nr:glycosyltransferase family 39 protein [Thiotrichales bacterium 19S9-11]MCF6811455.1 glycosyltransferase family 39 protein [Thiotrichales bacterium 19S9-12]
MIEKKVLPWKEICLFSLFVLLFNLLFLGSYQLISPDEARYIGVAWEMFKEGSYSVPTIAGSPFLGKPILFYWLSQLSFFIFGVNDFAARFFPSLLAASTAVMGYIAAFIIFNRRVAVLSLILIATTPLFFALGHYANMDGEVASWLNMSLFSLLIGLYLPDNQKQRHLWLCLAYLFAACAFLTKGLIGIAFPVMILFFWCLILNHWKVLSRIKLITGIFLFTAVILPWLVIVEINHPGFMAYFFIWNQVIRFVGHHFNMHNPFYYYVLLVIGGVFPWTVYLAQSYVFHIKAIYQNRKNKQTELMLLLWVVLITIFFSIPTSKLPGYIGPVFPASAMLMAIYLDRYWNVGLSKLNRVVTYLLSVLLLIISFGLFLLPFIWHDSAVYKTMPYGYFLAVVLALTSISLCYGLKTKKPFKWMVITLIVMNVLMNLTLIGALKYFNLQWNYPIADKIKPYLEKHPNAEVVMIGRYYYSVPLYLNKDIGIVADWEKGQNLGDNWKREIYEGVHYLDQLPKDLITYQQFSHQWTAASNKGKCLIVISSESPSNQFISHLIKGKDYQMFGRISRRGAYLFGTPSC